MTTPATGGRSEPAPEERTRISTRLDAQRRVNRIRAFQAELDALARDGLLDLTPEQHDRVARHHAAQLASLQQAFDVDNDDATLQMSRGMQAAAFFGAVAFSAAVFSFFYRYWGALSTPAQVAIVALAPLLALVGVEIAARRERTHYIASLLALVACACAVLEVIVLGDIFNMRSSPGAFLGWSAFGLALGYAYGFRLPYAAGLICLVTYLTGASAVLRGLVWTEGWWRQPELEMLLGGSLLFLPLLHARAAERERAAQLDPVVRAVGLALALCALLTLTYEGADSLLPLSIEHTGLLYQVIAFPVAALIIAVGVKRRQQETYITGVVFLLLFLLTRFVDWWWDWMPKYLFFLVLGLITLGILVGLRRARRTLLAKGLA